MLKNRTLAILTAVLFCAQPAIAGFGTHGRGKAWPQHIEALALLGHILAGTCSGYYISLTDTRGYWDDQDDDDSFGVEGLPFFENIELEYFGDDDEEDDDEEKKTLVTLEEEGAPGDSSEAEVDLTLEGMPNEVLMLIVMHLSDGKLAALSETSTSMYNLFKQELQKRKEQKALALLEKGCPVLALELIKECYRSGKVSEKGHAAFIALILKAKDQIKSEDPDSTPIFQEWFTRVTLASTIAVILTTDTATSEERTDLLNELIGDSKKIRGLISDLDCSVRGATIGSIGSILSTQKPSPKERKALLLTFIKATGTPFRYGQKKAAEAIGSILASEPPDSEERDAMLHLLIGDENKGGFIRNKDGQVRAAVATAIGTTLTNIKTANTDIHRALLKALIGNEGLGGLAKDPSITMRREAVDSIQIFLSTRTPSLSELKSLLVALIGTETQAGLTSDLNPAIRASAAKAIGTILAKNSTFPIDQRLILINALIGQKGKGGLRNDSDDFVRTAVAEAIEKIASSNTLSAPECEAFVAVLVGAPGYPPGLDHDEDKITRLFAVKAIRAILMNTTTPSPDALRRLVVALVGSKESAGIAYCSNPDIRAEVVYLFGDILATKKLCGFERALFMKLLIGSKNKRGLIDDPHEFVRRQIPEAIEKVLLTGASSEEESIVLIKVLKDRSLINDNDENIRTRAKVAKTIGVILAADILDSWTRNRLVYTLINSLKVSTKKQTFRFGQRPDLDLQNARIEAMEIILESGTSCYRDQASLEAALLVAKNKALMNKESS